MFVERIVEMGNKKYFITQIKSDEEDEL